MNTFGETISNLRTQKNLGAKEAAQALCIPQSRYIELEKGVRIPTDSQVARMEEYFGVKKGGLSKTLKQ